MRQPLVAGNWKMHGSLADNQALLTALAAESVGLKSDVAVFPSYVYLSQAQSLLADTPVSWGAQNIAIAEQGAFTGEVSGDMIAEFGARYVLVGHSERRQLYSEDNACVAEKFVRAQSHKLVPVLCVGETLEEREADKTTAVVLAQIEAVIKQAGIGALANAVIAYEPVWAIGTGLTATPEQAQEVHRTIREYLAEHDADIASAVKILYGGSVKPSNAKSLFDMPDIDGGLVGGASLNASDFLAICQAAG